MVNALKANGNPKCSLLIELLGRTLNWETGLLASSIPSSPSISPFYALTKSDVLRLWEYVQQNNIQRKPSPIKGLKKPLFLCAQTIPNELFSQLSLIGEKLVFYCNETECSNFFANTDPTYIGQWIDPLTRAIGENTAKKDSLTQMLYGKARGTTVLLSIFIKCYGMELTIEALSNLESNH
ncbi:hypothetical protein D5018_02360 [Parashewanella curva]|uniref:Uncharacterized protein n=1 Tax=Parashewanella curva TaxID=2338552 RepID=A0A3L8Q128_9GAMM|nr:hypothetical protein [Parashewanella curva]RLV61341.1 hypothetical protein D5018_02360 [Parashewanella curva]